MQTSDRGLLALIRHEGVVPGPYLDVKNVWTFGIGHTAAAGPPDPARMPRGMPGDLEAGIREAFRLFRADLAVYEAEVLRAVKMTLAPHEFDGLVSFHYNTGGIAKAALTRHLNAGNRAAAAAAFMGWLKPAAIRSRREAERDLFAKGRYPTGTIPVWSVDRNGRVDFSRPIRRLSDAEALALLRPLLNPPSTPMSPAPSTAATSTARAGGAEPDHPHSRLPQDPDRSMTMNWTLARGLVYLACLAASGLALAGLADFDLATGTLDIRPFNLYALTGATGGVVSSLLASVALLRGWGRK